MFDIIGNNWSIEDGYQELRKLEERWMADLGNIRSTARLQKKDDAAARA